MAKKKQKVVENIAEQNSPATQYLTETELRYIESLANKDKISKLNCDNTGLKIKVTELTINNLQNQLEKLKADFRKINEEISVNTDSIKKNYSDIKKKYNIEGQFGFDPLSGEIIL
jgi:SMC interacting uncharacterized protein involved in chromosome segregation